MKPKIFWDILQLSDDKQRIPRWDSEIGNIFGFRVFGSIRTSNVNPHLKLRSPEEELMVHINHHLRVERHPKLSLVAENWQTNTCPLCPLCGHFFSDQTRWKDEDQEPPKKKTESIWILDVL